MLVPLAPGRFRLLPTDGVTLFLINKLVLNLHVDFVIVRTEILELSESMSVTITLNWPTVKNIEFITIETISAFAPSNVETE
jgi:hypothetical protein